MGAYFAAGMFFIYSGDEYPKLVGGLGFLCLCLIVITTFYGMIHDDYGQFLFLFAFCALTIVAGGSVPRRLYIPDGLKYDSPQTHNRLTPLSIQHRIFEGRFIKKDIDLETWSFDGEILTLKFVNGNTISARPSALKYLFRQLTHGKEPIFEIYIEYQNQIYYIAHNTTLFDTWEWNYLFAILENMSATFEPWGRTVCNYPVTFDPKPIQMTASPIKSEMAPETSAENVGAVPPPSSAPDQMPPAPPRFVDHTVRNVVLAVVGAVFLFLTIMAIIGWNIDE